MEQEPNKESKEEEEIKIQQIKEETLKEQEVVSEDEEIPDHFYDSDMASINQKDFLSDNQPPKDTIQERKLLYKQKFLHVHKTIIRLGATIDKPARYDRISLRFREVSKQEVSPFPIKKDQQSQYIHPGYFNTFYLMQTEKVEYNLGKDYLDIQRLVVSMKRGEAAVFQLEHLETSKKNSIKKRVNVQVFVIWVDTWRTVIDIDCDGKLMKEVVTRGEGHSRISKFDEVSYEFILRQGERVAMHLKYEEPVKLEEEYLKAMPKVLWKLLYSMKAKEKIKVSIEDHDLRQLQGDQYSQLNSTEDKADWEFELEVFWFHSIDDIFLSGALLKKTIYKGVTTSKPDSACLAYFALQFLGPKGQVLYEDKCWNSDWWEDFTKLDVLGCRKNYLDDHSVSLMLKHTIKRMKPAEVAEVDCRDKTLFKYGTDYEQYKKLTGLEQIPDKIKMGGKNCFNMQIDEKVHQARRKKKIGVRYIEMGDLPRALKIFESIVAYFSAGNLDQELYDEKISALMNSTLCHLKNQNYVEMIKLCDLILETPKHGYDPTKMKIKGPGHAKIEGKLPDQADSGDQREDAELIQNPKIIDKCLYRKALALTRMGQGGKALLIMSKISVRSEQVIELEKQAEKAKQNYEKKSVKMFKNMFG